ncbi:four helix bundle protein [Marivirga sp. S37H4]|uniref:Four helix bundle protein n=1 Tax=Marivirga aurantiaca TaxID=2802615 RepID=A0A934X083_9BACT|nr:four helix bundle protein [Marivirga aurantiaca]MBK6266117.1 four helix bundle protein [Marivirga aurantiaca]
MATIKKFEDLESWKNARIFVKDIYKATTNSDVQNDFGFQDQIRRASISVMNNIAEGFGRFNNKEFRRFLDISVGSLLEVKSMLYVAEDLEYFSSEKVEQLRNDADKIYFQLLAFITYLRNTVKHKSDNK